MTPRHFIPGSRLLSYLQGHWVRAVSRGQRYLASLWWLIKFGLLSRKAHFWWLIVLASVSLGAQALAVGVIFGYVSLMEGATPIQLVSIPMDWLRSRYGLFVFVASVAMLLALNHLALYRVRVMAIDWARNTEIFCGRLVLSMATQLPDLARPLPSAKAMDLELRSLINANARYCGLTIRLMVLSVPTVVALAGSMLGLFLVDWGITCVIVALGAVIFLFQYPANLKGANATRRFHASRPDAVKQILATIESLRLGSRRPDAKVLPNRDPYSLPSVSKSIDAYANRMRAIEIGTLATQMGTTLLIAAIILFIGDRVFTGAAGWASLLAYVSLLRVASGNFSGVARYTTSMARLYPQVQDFVGVVNAYERPELPDALKTRDWAIRIKAPNNREKTDSGSVKVNILERSRQIAIVTVGARLGARPDFALSVRSRVDPLLSASNGAAAEAEESSAEGGTQGGVVLVACGRLQTGALPRNILGLTDDVKQEEWQAALEELRRVRPNLAREIDACTFADLDHWSGPIVQEARVGLVALIASALLRRASVVVLERDALKVLDCRTVEDPLFQRLQRDSLVAIWYQRDQVLGKSSLEFGEQTALVCVGEVVEAVIDFTRAGAGEYLAATTAKSDKTFQPLDEDLDDAMF